MQFTKPFWPGLADGSITMTFRRWKRRRVVAGNRYRTPAGILEVEEVGVVEAASITDPEARRSGFADAATLVAQLRSGPDLPIYRIVFHRIDEPDPRRVLAADARLDEAAVAALARRLDRMDRTAQLGPWTRQTLRLIAANPGRRAPDLAVMAGKESPVFKRDVRKLKELGLTESLHIGYRLSARGEAFLEATGTG